MTPLKNNQKHLLLRVDRRKSNLWRPLLTWKEDKLISHHQNLGVPIDFDRHLRFFGFSAYFSQFWSIWRSSKNIFAFNWNVWKVFRRLRTSLQSWNWRLICISDFFPKIRHQLKKWQEIYYIIDCKENIAKIRRNIILIQH